MERIVPLMSFDKCTYYLFLNRFAFAETESSEMIEKAKAEMEGVEIQGRKLRVRR